MMKFRENEDAVSPVIGVILMVAITVILAAVIAAFAFQMTGSIETPKNVGLTAKQISDNQLQVTVQGGTDLSTLEYLRIGVVRGDNGEAKTYCAYVKR
jgi:flagellin-like protein